MGSWSLLYRVVESYDPLVGKKRTQKNQKGLVSGRKCKGRRRRGKAHNLLEGTEIGEESDCLMQWHTWCGCKCYHSALSC